MRETQPDCRLYIAITKCDQLEEVTSVAEQDTPEPDSSSSSHGIEERNPLDLNSHSHVRGFVCFWMMGLSCRHATSPGAQHIL